MNKKSTPCIKVPFSKGKRKGGFLKQVRVNCRTGRGGGDPYHIWTTFLKAYDNFKNAYNEEDEESQQAIKDEFNAILEDFGNNLVESK